MFEKTIHKLIEEISKEADFGGKKKVETIISEYNLPEWFVKYLQAEVGWWIYREKIVISSSHHFEVPDDVLGTCFGNLENLYSENAYISKAEYDKICEMAVKLRINYLSRPRTTLLWTIFRNEPTRTKEEILKRLDFFNEYEYLLSSIHEQIGSKYPGESNNLVSSREFSEIISQADENHLFQLTPGEFIELLDSLFDTLGSADESGEIALPVEALLIFLDDKGIKPVIDYVLKSIEGNNIFSVTRDWLKEILYNLITDSEPNEELSISESFGTEDQDDQDIEYESASETSTPESDGGLELEDENHTVDKPVEDPGPDSDPTPPALMAGDIEEEDKYEFSKPYQPFDLMRDELDYEEDNLPNSEGHGKGLIQDDDLPLIDTESIEIIADSSSEEFYDLDIMLSGVDGEEREPHDKGNVNLNVIEEEFKEDNFASGDAQNEDSLNEEESGNLKTMANLIDEKTESRFVRKVFNYDISKYNNLIDILDTCTDWKDAATKIDIFFAEHSIDPLSSASEEFRELIRKRFN